MNIVHTSIKNYLIYRILILIKVIGQSNFLKSFIIFFLIVVLYSYTHKLRVNGRVVLL